jgi:epoxyqueuosine reductase QueG
MTTETPGASTALEVATSPGSLRGLPPAAAEQLVSAGFNVAGSLAMDRYDALVTEGWRSALQLPGARTVIVLGCGGRAFERAFAAAPEAADPENPVDRYTARVVGDVARLLRDSGHETRALYYWDRLAASGAPAADGAFADMVALGRAAGLGEPGRLRVLLHPTFGPWFSLRALLLTRLRSHATEETPPCFDPCSGCPAPCADACLGSALAAGPLDLATCTATRLAVTECETSCAARHACVIGREHAYGSEAEAHYMRASFTSASSLPPGVSPR